MNHSIRLNGSYYTTAAAAAALSLTEGRIRQLVRSGQLSAVTVSPRTDLIPALEIRRFLNNRKKTAKGG